MAKTKKSKGVVVTDTPFSSTKIKEPVFAIVPSTVTKGAKETVRLFEVKSSNLSMAGQSKETLVVEFKDGKRYMYYPVTFKMYHDMIHAESIGKHFNEKIKKGEDIECIKL